jgi:hypothetical protein
MQISFFILGQNQKQTLTGLQRCQVCLTQAGLAEKCNLPTCQRALHLTASILKWRTIDFNADFLFYSR